MLNADGTLQLDEKPALAPGRVTVVLRQEAVPGLAEDPAWRMVSIRTPGSRLPSSPCIFNDPMSGQGGG